jgi:hypothetical protein
VGRWDLFQKAAKSCLIPWNGSEPLKFSTGQPQKMGIVQNVRQGYMTLFSGINSARALTGATPQTRADGGLPEWWPHPVSWASSTALSPPA